MTFVWRKMPTSANAGTKIYPWIYIVGGKNFVFYVEGAYSVWNNHDEFLLKNVFCTILLKLQFLTCHKFAVFSDSHQLSELPFQWFDPIKWIMSVERLDNFVPALPLYLSLEPPRDIAKVLSTIFNLSLAQTIWCSLPNSEKQTCKSQLSIWLIFRGYCKRVWHMHQITKLTTSNRCFHI